jgi:hypothetical protein
MTFHLSLQLKWYSFYAFVLYSTAILLWFDDNKENYI